jgi:hypothetical protein
MSRRSFAAGASRALTVADCVTQLSPAQRKVIAAVRKRGSRRLPRGHVAAIGLGMIP